ncbi:MAG TPA: CGNR zinc finger domain-containing protein [Acidimicrobiia bacterium]|nr:CGNR zinc finger domain-containing protein [Acidimicrobiia bacterium]
MTSKITPAPEGLELVRRFANTLDIEEGTDALAHVEEARQWLKENDLDGDDLSHAELEYLTTLREAMRDALSANHSGGELTEETLAVLNQAAAAARISPELHGSEVKLVAHARGIEGAVGSLLIEMLEAMRAGIWARLKICHNDTCQWAFYDRSRARSGKWCSMSICGNRTKQQAFRERHSADS